MRRWGLAFLCMVALVVVALFFRRNRDDGPPGRAPKAPAPAATRTKAPDHLPSAAAPAWIEGSAPRKRVAGRVTADGAPVPGAVVRIATFTSVLDASAVQQTRTLADGTFDFGPQPALVTWLAASAPGKAETVLSLNPADPKLDPPSDRLEIMLLPCTGGIFGFVSDASGVPVVGARVHRRETAAEVATSDGAGKFDLCLPRGAAVVFVEADGYGTLALDLQVMARTRRDVVLVPEATVSGRCLRDQDEQPVEGAVVTIMPDPSAAGENERAAFRSAVSAADGTFHVGGLPSGRFVATALSEHGKTARPAPISAAAGQVGSELVLRLQHTATVTGTVMSEGKPVGGILVFLVNESPRPYPSGFTNPDGTFEIQRVPSAKNRFTAWPYRVVSPESLEVVAPATSGVAVDVARMAAIRGLVAHDGHPVVDAEVRCLGPSRPRLPRPRTNASGRFACEGLRGGVYSVYASDDASGFWAADPARVELADGEDRDVTIELAASASIAGRVVDQDGHAMAGVRVDITKRESEDYGHAVTDEAGAFSVQFLQGGGSYDATVARTGARSGPYHAVGAPPVVAVASASTHVDGVTLTVQNDALTIRGTVVDATGAPAADARVIATASAGTIIPTMAGEGGAFVLADLAAGTYDLRARASGAEGSVAGVAAGSSGVAIRLQPLGRIEGKLAGFARSPRVVVQLERVDAPITEATVTGDDFTADGLVPGPYLVTAMNPDEGEARQVEVTVGKATPMTLTSHGRAVVRGRIADRATHAPAGGLRCRAPAARG